jgi:serine/threonine protein kinase
VEREREREKGSMLQKKLVAALVDRSRKKREKERAFLENGGLVLEKLVASCNGRPIPIRTFSYQELILATNNFDHRLVLCNHQVPYNFYKASFEGRNISVRRYYDKRKLQFALTDIGISAKMSAHTNILKLIGCCLETSIPTLVYEYAQNGGLADQIFISRRQGTPMVWHSRLKIARQIAHAIAYLHTAFSRPIIHLSIKLENIFLDQHDVPKLTDFSFSVSIPEGETHVELDRPRGNICFLRRSVMQRTWMVTEKNDVHSFGVVLLELLSGQDCGALFAGSRENWIDYFRNGAMDEIRDPAILAEGGEAGVEQQLQAVLHLALTCIEDDPEIRPTMVNVTKELRRIERFLT